MSSLRDLLPVQELDTKELQLRYRRANLDLRAELSRQSDLLQAQASTVADLQGQLHGIQRSQKEAEDHASLLADRIVALDKSLYGGAVTDRKELGAMQAELAQLRDNQDRFETDALELMEQADPVEEELSSARALADEITSQISSTEEQLIVAETEIDAELAAASEQRSQMVENVDDELIHLYETMRGMPGGIAVAEMTGRRCGGCHLEIPSGQAEQIRSATDPRSATCPECGCLLVT